MVPGATLLAVVLFGLAYAARGARSRAVMVFQRRDFR